jgi:diacylglycerol kinase (ATP)
MMSRNYQNKKLGVSRVLSTFINTYNGLIWMTKNEAAFKQELLLILLLLPVSLILPVSPLEHLVLVIPLLFILFAETINTAIEAVTDRIGYEHHQLSGLAKDLGSAAVLISFVIAGVTWGVILWTL